MSPHQSNAHYRIVSKLGEGMGAVWRARDTKLNRDVAIEVLQPAFAQHAGRMQRFEREAQVPASLHRPNIASFYGVESRAIVMELVEFSTAPNGSQYALQPTASDFVSGSAETSDKSS